MFEYLQNAVPDAPSWCVGPTLYQDDEGTVHMIFTANTEEGEDKPAQLYHSQSHDSGHTWTPAVVFRTDSNDKLGIFNPVSIRLACGDVLLFYNIYAWPWDERIHMERWTADRGWSGRPGSPIDTGFSYATTRANPIHLADGIIIVPFNYSEPMSNPLNCVN